MKPKPHKKRISRGTAEKMLFQLAGVEYPCSFLRKFPKTPCKVLHLEGELNLWQFRDEPLNRYHTNGIDAQPRYYIVGSMRKDGDDIQQYLQEFRKQKLSYKNRRP